MASPSSYLRALVASLVVGGVAATGATAPPATAETAPPVATAVAQAPDEPDDAPLGVIITSMTPGSLPATGNIVVTGKVTNRTDEDWASISLYAFVGDGAIGPLDDPFTSQGALQDAMDTEFDAVVGQRLTGSGDFGEVETLAPGATADYRVVVPVSAIDTTTAGVYWFGVHALGESASTPRDEEADGRARTFLPIVPRRFHDDPLDVALVLPLEEPVRYDGNGTVADPEKWARALGPDGRLSRLLDLGDRAPTVTWLVDPAVVDAVAHLAAGNKARSLGPAAAASASADPTGQPPADPDPPSPEAQVAAAWLDHLGRTLRNGQVLTVPYGNPDLPATLAHAPQLLDVARAQRSSALADLGVESRPVLTSPTGYLDEASIAAADADTRVLLTDRMFAPEAVPDDDTTGETDETGETDGTDDETATTDEPAVTADPPPVAADVDGRRVLVTSYGATQGSPGPGPALTAVGVRQRLLAEAAVREVTGDRRPLVAVLPVGWPLDDPGSFFAALDVPWLDLGSLEDVEAAATLVPAVDAGDLTYPQLQSDRELSSTTVDGVADLVTAGDTLQNLLLDNTAIGGTVTEEALTGLSYFVRYDESAGQVAALRARDWVEERLAGVEIGDSPGITLASSAGEFNITLTNNLDHQVAVSVRAESDDGIEVTAPERVVLAPRGRATARLTARATTNSVHNVRLRVTDSVGTPVGSYDDVPIRPTQVSDVIWLIMGTGAGLLFLAIAVRLVRRVRAARRGEPGAGRRASRAADPQPSVELG